MSAFTNFILIGILSEDPTFGGYLVKPLKRLFFISRTLENKRRRNDEKE